MLIGVAFYGLCMLGFAVSHVILMSVILLAGTIALLPPVRRFTLSVDAQPSVAIA
ncbi:MAG: hypothetical protein ACHQ7M_02435 [Chloroflexota bacterium]